MVARVDHGLKVRGVKVFDESNRQIVELASLDSELSLLDVVRGNYGSGETTIAGLNVTFRQYADGTNNLSKLAKPSTEPDERRSRAASPRSVATSSSWSAAATTTRSTSRASGGA